MGTSIGEHATTFYKAFCLLLQHGNLSPHKYLFDVTLAYSALSVLGRTLNKGNSPVVLLMLQH